MLCGAIKVPFERRDPSLGKTRVGFAVRLRDDRDRPSLGTIVAVEGGPGYASSWTASSYVNLFGSLLRRREMVTIDMRGTGRSGVLDCPDLQRGRAPDWIALSACARRLGPLYGSYRTSAAADDINDVRRALRPRAHHPVRGLLRDLPRPVLCLSASEDARCAGARLGLSGARREPLVPVADLRPGSARSRSPAGALRRAPETPASGLASSSAGCANEPGAWGR